MGVSKDKRKERTGSTKKKKNGGWRREMRTQRDKNTEGNRESA